MTRPGIEPHPLAHSLPTHITQLFSPSLYFYLIFFFFFSPIDFFVVFVVKPIFVNNFFKDLVDLNMFFFFFFFLLTQKEL